MRPHGRSLRIDFRFPRPLWWILLGLFGGLACSPGRSPLVFLPSPPLPPFSVANREGGETSA